MMATICSLAMSILTSSRHSEVWTRAQEDEAGVVREFILNPLPQVSSHNTHTNTHLSVFEYSPVQHIQNNAAYTQTRANWHGTVRLTFTLTL
jgi:hypothetical protein